MKEQKDVRQRIEEGEFAQSAEISASYLDEDILIIDNVKVLQNPDPMRFQMNMIASCQRGSLRAELNGREIVVEKGDLFISPPNSTSKRCRKILHAQPCVSAITACLVFFVLISRYGTVPCM